MPLLRALVWNFQLPSQIKFLLRGARLTLCLTALGLPRLYRPINLARAKFFCVLGVIFDMQAHEYGLQHLQYGQENKNAARQSAPTPTTKVHYKR
jgi:hypothetical protein